MTVYIEIHAVVVVVFVAVFAVRVIILQARFANIDMVAVFVVDCRSIVV